MVYEVYLGDRAFSSWSLRAWLLFEQFDLPKRIHMTGLYSGKLARDLAALAPARLVPVVKTPDGQVIGESLAILETLAERHPEAGLWPADPAARAFARWITAEMHAGFAALRSDCPMQLLHRYDGFQPSQAVLGDLDRITELFTHARKNFAGSGPWLFGAYSAADAFYAPVAARIAGYGLPMNGVVAEYVQETLADPAFRRWRAEGLTIQYDPQPYALDLPTSPWPGPVPLAARPVQTGVPVNATCPYSGKAPTHLMEVSGKIIGFCNATCRDKSLHDPLAFAPLRALLAP
ncbi:glutathione S-transferase [Pseudooceanicola algae]|uniref:Uncharacterized protein n=1 Tax=Pseudooceanicola algae TaxID=1537215 RepID=A0A418SGT0_9RHOB|nr:glutathione S-transferase [Pseudooceanicola algae]QPM88873.1 hypothetical protein PSAL_000760 [Pseudooceanicola algae]